MAVKIRLARGGTTHRPFHKIVVADSRAPRDGNYIERIGSYNPMLERDNPNRVLVDVERAKYWLSKGAQPSERIANILAELGACEKPERRETTKKHLPKAKAQERLKEIAEKEAAAKAAAEEAAAEAAAAAAAPAAEEAPAEAPVEEAAPAAETPAPEAEAAPEAAAEEKPAEA